MIQEDKDLLLKDLCARLPYGVKIERVLYGAITLNERMIESFRRGIDDILIPYLRPMSSMTEEERTEFYKVGGLMSHKVETNTYILTAFNPEAYDWLNKRHFDYRGLINKGLAIEVTRDNNPYKY